MKPWKGILIAGVLTSLLIDGSAGAGAKGGKIRWSHRGTGKCKWYEAIKVPAEGQIELKIIYEANKLAEFFVIGDGDTDLGLYVYDSAGREVAKDVDPPAHLGGGSDLCYCRWRPQKEEEFTIRIKNWGNVYNMVTAGSN